MKRTFVFVVFVAVLCLQLRAESLYAHFGLPSNGVCTTGVPLQLKTSYLGMERIHISTNASDGVINSFTLFTVMRPESNTVETLEKECWNLNNRLCEEFSCSTCLNCKKPEGSWFATKCILMKYVGWTASVSCYACSTTCNADGSLVGTNYMVSCRFENEWLNARRQIEKPGEWEKEEMIHEDPIAKRYYIYIRDKDGHLQKSYLPWKSRSASQQARSL